VKDMELERLKVQMLNPATGKGTQPSKSISQFDEHLAAHI
jgi:hypothetical protein